MKRERNGFWIAVLTVALGASPACKTSRPPQDRGARPKVEAAVRTRPPNAVELEVSVGDTRGPVVITEIHVDRWLRDALRLQPPAGFEERENPDAARRFREVGYLGRRAVRAGVPEVLRFAVERPVRAAGGIRLHFDGAFHGGIATPFRFEPPRTEAVQGGSR